MDSKVFVYPEVEEHKPYRTLTRESLLRNYYGDTYVYYDPKNIDVRIVFPEFVFKSLDEIKYLPKDSTRQKFIDTWFIQKNGGINLCDEGKRTRGIREGGMRLRRHRCDYDGPVAFEVISWGVGVFRQVMTTQDTPFMQCLDGKPLPKVTSEHLKILEYQIVPRKYQKQGEHGYIKEWGIETKLYESTNIILADSYGELEQIHRRSKDELFLQKYLDQLKQTTEFKKYFYMDDEVPEGFGGVIDTYVRAWLKHIKLGLWEKPPQSTGELVERVDFLLENIIVDENARMIVTDYEYQQLI